MYFDNIDIIIAKITDDIVRILRELRKIMFVRCLSSSLLSDIYLVNPSGIPTDTIKIAKVWKLSNCDIIPRPETPRIRENIFTLTIPRNIFVKVKTDNFEVDFTISLICCSL